MEYSMPLDLKRSWFCNAIFVVLVVLLATVLFPDRSSKFDYDLLDQSVLDSDVVLARHRDPLRMKVDRATIPKMLQLGPTTDSVSLLEAREFIDSQVLPWRDKPTDDAATKLYATFGSRMLTPLQATMMFMGCYGYVYDDSHHTTSPKNTYSLLENQKLWTHYTTPFLLQALENKNAAGAGHDKSVCSCMKDFGNPTLVSLKDDEHALQKAVQDKLVDTCSMQNTVDYALAGPAEEVLPAAATKDELSKSVLLMPMGASDKSRRQRKDPFSTLLEEAAAAVTSSDKIDENKLHFITAYCDISSSNCNGLPVATTSLATLTNEQFFGFLLARANGVRPHNKLRPPQLCSGAQGTASKCEPNLKHGAIPSVSAATYNAYLDKYRQAFHMCSRAGVPQYTTLRVGRIRPHRVYNIGQCFLFLAALFAYTWSFMIAHYIESSKEAHAPDTVNKDEIAWDKSNYRWMLFGGSALVALAWIFLLIALVRGWFWNGSDDDTKFQKNQIPHETDGTSTFFIVFFWVVAIGFIAVFTYLQIKFFELSRADIGAVYEAGYTKIKDWWPRKDTEETVPMAGLVDGSELFAKIVSEAGTKQSIVKTFNNAITRHLQSLAPYAQVALDLSVIAGLTTLAVAIVGQRGVQDINVVSAVSLWFVAIGLMAHLSNMLRLVHVYLQLHPEGVFSVHVQKAAHHRLYLAVLLGLMLFVYTVLAGVDSGITTSSHTVLHQILFAVVALIVLCGTDVVEHLAGITSKYTVDTDAYATTERFWLNLSTKNLYLSWIILLALAFLHLHRARGICEAAKGTFSTVNCLFLTA